MVNENPKKHDFSHPIFPSSLQFQTSLLPHTVFQFSFPLLLRQIVLVRIATRTPTRIFIAKKRLVRALAGVAVTQGVQKFTHVHTAVILTGKFARLIVPLDTLIVTRRKPKDAYVCSTNPTNSNNSLYVHAHKRAFVYTYTRAFIHTHTLTHTHTQQTQHSNK